MSKISFVSCPICLGDGRLLPAQVDRSGNHSQLVERLRFHELDVVVSEMAMVDPDLVNMERIETPVALACSANRKIKTGSRHFKDLRRVREIIEKENFQWVMPSSKFKLRQETDQFFENHSLNGRIVFESDVLASLVRSVIDEIGLALLPTIYISRELNEKTLVALGPTSGFWKYRIWLSCHKQSQNDPLIQSLGRSFKAVYREI